MANLIGLPGQIVPKLQQYVDRGSAELHYLRKIIESGAIRLQPIDDTKSPTAGGDVTGGKYIIHQARGPMVGTFRVEFNSLKKTGKKIVAGSPAPPGTMVDEYAEAIPALYTGEKSPLRASVKAGRNTIDFEITSK